MAEQLAIRDSSRILHHLYGEDTLWLSASRRFRGKKKMIVTFHQPETRFKQVMPVYWKKMIQSIDCVITLFPKQYEFLREVLGTQNLVLVEHGIDTEYFNPPVEKNSSLSFCLCVGDHLRDYATLLEAMRFLSREVPELKLVVVSNRLGPAERENVAVLRRISDQRLLDLYRAASFLVLPVNEATASNTLLEGMACGLPVVTTRQVSFYTNERGCLYYEPGDVKGLCMSITNLAHSSDLRTRLGREARARAEELSWDRVAQRTLELYERFA